MTDGYRANDSDLPALMFSDPSSAQSFEKTEHQPLASPRTQLLQSRHAVLAAMRWLDLPLTEEQVTLCALVFTVIAQQKQSEASTQ